MLAQFAAPFLLLLLLIHAMLGYVELGTDSWISNITGNIVGSKQGGLYLFVYTSMLMFVLRFFAGPIVERISPLGLLFAGACCGSIGLFTLSGAGSLMLVIVAPTIYGFGKTFLWPTMLAVASERFPKGGAVVIGAMGGIGMLSAGMLGGPGIGYNWGSRRVRPVESRRSGSLRAIQGATGTNHFLFFREIQGLDGSKVNPLREKAEAAAGDSTAAALTPAELQGCTPPISTGVALRFARQRLVPATMASLYLLIIIYFKVTGGYAALHVKGEEETGGIAGPVQA